MRIKPIWKPSTVPILACPLVGDQAERFTVESIAFSRCGSHLAALACASGVTGGHITVWDIGSATVLAETKGRGSLAFSQDGRFLATGLDQHACLYDTTTWKLVHEFGSQDHPVNCVAFAPGDKVLAVGDYQKLVLWDVASGNLLKSLRAHPRVVEALAFAPDGKTLVSRSFDDMTFWNLKNGCPLCKIRGLCGPTCDGCFTLDGKTFVSGRDEESFARWTLKGARRGVFEDPRAHGYYLTVRYSPDGMAIATGGQDEKVHLWDPNTRTLQDSLSGPVRWVNGIAFSPDGRLLAAASGSRVHLWTRSTAKAAPPRGAAVGRDKPSLDLTSVNAFVDRLKTIRWFANVGKAKRRDANIFRLRDWDQWPGPEDASVAKHYAPYQSWRDELSVTIRTYGLVEVERFWREIQQMTIALARTCVPFDPEADAWVPTSQCVHDAAFCAALIACYLRMEWAIPKQLAEDWHWYEAGHWPCGYGVL